MASSLERSTSSNAGDSEIKEQPQKSNEHVPAKSDVPRLPSSSPQPLKRASTTPLPTPHFSAPPSATNSPKPSRETSPIRPLQKPGSAAASRGSRSRKNSEDISPSRGSASGIPTVPSAAAIQRALSAAGGPQWQPSTSSDLAVDATKPQRPSKGGGLASNHLGLNLPPVKSPSPSAGTTKASIYSPRKLEQTKLTPSITLERPTPVTGSHEGIDEGEEYNIPPSGMRTPVRGISSSGPTLETVQESSLPATPAISTTKTNHGGTIPNEDRPESISENPIQDAFQKGPKSRPESGSESGGNRSAGATTDQKQAKRIAAATSNAKPHIMHPKKSFTQLHPAKGKTGSEGTVKNMTVETETVSTIPQVALGGGAGERNVLGRVDTGGSLRLKPSNETIRPKKEKKRVTRKAPTHISGTGGCLFRRFHHHHVHTRPSSPELTLSLSSTSAIFTPSYVSRHEHPQYTLQPSNRNFLRAQRRSIDHSPSDLESASRRSSTVLTNFRGRLASSKADIFEAKVASAVDEVNSSDSEETFVYESNPPEPLSARPHRFHSRTPSATSMASQMDQYGAKGRQDGHHSIAGKKSMKFANNSYHTTTHAGESNDGTIRGPSQTGRTAGGPVSHHHHIGRYGRGGAGHASLFGSDSPFPNAARPARKLSNHSTRSSPRPASPWRSHLTKISGSPRKSSEPVSYDLEGDGADDERTPLVGSIRSGRNRRRPTPGSLRNGHSLDEKEHPLCRRVTAFMSLGALLALFFTAIIVILFMCSKPLYDVRVKDIRNVLASEAELMLDLRVYAVNPNLVAIQVSDLDVNIFAKSRYVGTSAYWRDRSRQDHTEPLPSREYHTSEGVDKGTDPIDIPETDLQTMLLGRIFEFDSPLIFDPSPIRRQSLPTMGEVRLAKPGNRTEAGGSARWERVLQHDFELIVRGVLKYSTPITSALRSASIGGSVLVHAGGGDEDTDSHPKVPRSHPDAAGSHVALRKPDQPSWLSVNFVA